MEKAVAVTWR